MLRETTQTNVQGCTSDWVHMHENNLADGGINISTHTTNHSNPARIGVSHTHSMWPAAFKRWGLCMRVGGSVGTMIYFHACWRQRWMNRIGVCSLLCMSFMSELCAHSSLEPSG